MQYLPETLKNKQLTAQQLKEWGFTSDQQNHWTRTLYIPYSNTMVKYVPEITLEDDKIIALTLANQDELRDLPQYVNDIALARILDAIKRV